MNTKLEIEAALKKYFEAFSRKSTEQLNDCLDDSFSYYTDNCAVQRKREFIEFMVNNSWQSAGYQIIDLEIITSSDSNLVIAVYNAEFDGTSGGKPMKVIATETTILKKLDGIWKLLHSHTSNKI